MIWFFIALVGPLLWALVNHTDKFLLSSGVEGGKPGALMIISTVVGVIVSLIVIVFKPDVLQIPLQASITLIITGILISLNILLYLFALNKSEASVIVPFYQLIPVIGLVLAYFILGETISVKELIAGGIILIGAIVLSFEIDAEEGFSFKYVTSLLMIAASFLIALSEVVFKAEALESDFWTSIFWQHIGLGIFGIFLLIFFPTWRRDFVELIRTNSKKMFFLNAGSETISILGNLVFSFATLLAPIALVMLVNAYQPVFVFIIGIILTIFFPHISVEKISKKHLIHRSAAIGIVLLGTVLLYT